MIRWLTHARIPILLVQLMSAEVPYELWSVTRDIEGDDPCVSRTPSDLYYLAFVPTLRPCAPHLTPAKAQLVLIRCSRLYETQVFRLYCRVQTGKLKSTPAHISLCVASWTRAGKWGNLYRNVLERRNFGLRLQGCWQPTKMPAMYRGIRKYPSELF